MYYFPLQTKAINAWRVILLWGFVTNREEVMTTNKYSLHKSTAANTTPRLDSGAL